MQDGASFCQGELENFCSTLENFAKQRPILYVVCGDKEGRFLGGHAGSQDQQGCSYMIVSTSEQDRSRPLNYRDHGGCVFTVEEFCEYALGHQAGAASDWGSQITTLDGQPLEDWLRQESVRIFHASVRVQSKRNPRIWFYWPGESRWFKGEVEHFDEKSGLCHVKYIEDGAEEIVCLAGELCTAKKQRKAPAVGPLHIGLIDRFKAPIKNQGSGQILQDNNSTGPHTDDQLIVAASTLSSLATPEAPPTAPEQEEDLQNAQTDFDAQPSKRPRKGISTRSSLDPSDPEAVMKVADPNDPAVVMTMNEELMDVLNELEVAGLLSRAAGMQFLLRWQSTDPVQRMLLFRTIERSLLADDVGGLQRAAQLIAIKQDGGDLRSGLQPA